MVIFFIGDQIIIATSFNLFCKKYLSPIYCVPKIRRYSFTNPSNPSCYFTFTFDIVIDFQKRCQNLMHLGRFKMKNCNFLQFTNNYFEKYSNSRLKNVVEFGLTKFPVFTCFWFFEKLQKVIICWITFY